MKYGLGIDTGGTYTDAAIYNFNSGKVLYSAKSITVKENLTVGITNTLNQLPLDMLSHIKMVSLSTTLATNACVEGKEGRAVLILIGCDRDIVKTHGHKYGLPTNQEIIFVDGGHNQQGEAYAEPDWDFLHEKVIECNSKADSFGIVELWGIRNPEFEIKAKQLILKWTEKPVVCGHELTAEINSLKRAVSTLLNAQLIPLINDFMNAVKASLTLKGIDAPLVIVRGDGSLMSEEFAREKPVETLLSGPAASVAGGTNLSKEKDCIVVDMGGTTSDLAIVKNGMARLAQEGVDVGNWRTGTKSIQISTVGLGGDSFINFNNNNEILIGPVRAAPLSWLANRWPAILQEIRLLEDSKKRHTHSLCQFFYLIKDISEDSYYTKEETKIVNALKEGPLSITALSEAVRSSIYSIHTKRLEKLGIIMRSALTPTDIMHISGDFSDWDKEAATLGANIMAYQLNMELDDFVQAVNLKIKEKLYFNIVKLLAENENEDILKGGISKQFSELITMTFEKSQKKTEYMRCAFTTDLTLVGIGAPIHIYLPDVAKILKTNCIIPENAGVANAVGAITGNVSVQEEVVVKPVYNENGITGYIAYSSAEKKNFEEYQEALDWAKVEADKLARENALARGAGQVSVVVDFRENVFTLPSIYSVGMKGSKAEKENSAAVSINKKVQGKQQNNKLLLETTVTACAIGSLKWL